MVVAVFIEPEHDRMKEINANDNELEHEEKPSRVSEHGIKRGSAFQIGDDIPRPQQHKYRHSHEVQRGVGELERSQAQGVQNPPKGVRDIIDQHGNQEATVFSLNLRSPRILRRPQNVPVGDDQNDACQNSDNGVGHAITP